MNKTTTHKLIVKAITLSPQDLHRKLPDLESLCPYFGWVPQTESVILLKRPANITEPQNVTPS